jgi:hypothetical protein
MNIDKDIEWQAQERALQDEREGTTSHDPLVARYRVITQALRQPQPHGLPSNFAEMMAARARHAAPLDTTFEQRLVRVLTASLGVSGVAAAAWYGPSWWPAIAEVLPLSSGTAVNWALALGACVGASWLFDALRRRTHHA